ncbi:MAG: NAD(P)H-binding protein [Marmoricola sp.]
MTDTPPQPAGGPVLVAGGTGFVGRRLVEALAETGREVRVMTRRPERYHGPGTAVHGDVADAESLEAPMAGCTHAYYLVHSLDREDFEDRDARAAEAFGAAAAAAGVRQIVYLGGLGSDRDDLSPHLRSRREVEKLLAARGVPVTVLRAGIVVGHGGISWEITRQLVEHLPAMVTPRWVSTRTQPIAVDDVIAYLVGVLDHPAALGRTFEIGGPEVLRYSDMLKRVAAIERRPMPIVPVPLLTPRLSSWWLAFVTDVDTRSGRNLIDSMCNTVVVTDHSIDEVVPLEPMSYDEAVRAALAERKAQR